jgi:hypothetical protein
MNTDGHGYREGNHEITRKLKRVTEETAEREEAGVLTEKFRKKNEGTTKRHEKYENELPSSTSHFSLSCLLLESNAFEEGKGEHGLVHGKPRSFFKRALGP